MSSYTPRFQLPPPADWTAFEDLCWGLWRTIWNDTNTQKNGRKGQSQHGVDVFGQPGNNVAWAGVQCKGKDNFTEQQLTEKEILKEVKKAKKFTPALSDYTIATTAPRNEALQTYARRLTARHQRVRGFRVSVNSWEDIEDLLFAHEPPIAAQFYPRVFGGELAGLLKKLTASLPQKTLTFTATASTGDVQVERMSSDIPDVSPLTPQPANNTFTDPQKIGTNADRGAPELSRGVWLRQAVCILESIHHQLGQTGTQGERTSSDTALASAVDRAVRTMSRNDQSRGQGQP